MFEGGPLHQCGHPGCGRVFTSALSLDEHGASHGIAASAVILPVPPHPTPVAASFVSTPLLALRTALESCGVTLTDLQLGHLMAVCGSTRAHAATQTGEEEEGEGVEGEAGRVVEEGEGEEDEAFVVAGEWASGDEGGAPPPSAAV